MKAYAFVLLAFTNHYFCTMQLSLIIPVYKNILFLNAILSRLHHQEYQKFEVIVAEDDHDEKMREYLSNMRENVTFKLKHVSQEDKGFRKNKIMNKAISVAESEFLVFIDGDCVPAPKFLKEYSKAAQKNTIHWGRRVMLDEELTNKMLVEENPITFPSFMQLVNSKSEKIEEAVYSPYLNMFRTSDRNFKGCNWGIFKEDILKVNGFDEDYVHATAGEDDDMEWRLKSIGLEKKSLRNKAIVYHLYHKQNYNEDAIKINSDLIQEKMKIGEAVIEKGISQYL